MQSSFTTVVSLTLGHLSLSTCVRSRYGLYIVMIEDFLGSCLHCLGIPRDSTHHSLDLCVDLPAHHLLCLDPNPLRGTAYLLRLSVSNAKVRNINLISIDYAFRPRLRSRLTLGGRPLPQETLLNRCSRFSLLFVTHTGILTCSRSTAAYAATSMLLQRSPTTRIATNPKLRCHA